MTESITVSADDLRRAVAIRQRFAELTHEYGKLGFAECTLKREKVSIEARFDNLAKEEEELVKQLNDTYGVGTMNIETGKFTPDDG